MFIYKKTLAVLLLMISMAFMLNSLWAEETPLDESATPPAEIPTADTKYTGLPIINFYLSDDDFLIIKVDGLLIGDVDGFSWNSGDISEQISQFKESGVVEITERDDGFQMLVNMPIQQLAGKNEFGVRYLGDNKLSATIDSEKLIAELKSSDDRGFGYARVFGTITERGGCCYCGQCGTQYASHARVHFYLWKGSWVYIGSTTTTAKGYYNVSFQGNDASRMLIVAEHNGKKAAVSSWGPACACTAVKVRANLYLK